MSLLLGPLLGGLCEPNTIHERVLRVGKDLVALAALHLRLALDLLRHFSS